MTNESDPSQLSPPHMADEDLIREIEQWGERQCSHSPVNAVNLRLKANEKSRRTFRWTSVACAVMATSVISIAWRSRVRPPDDLQFEIANGTAFIFKEPESLLQSIGEQTQNVEFLSESLNANKEQEQQAASEIQDLNGMLINLRRVAFRNAILLSQNP